MLRSGKMFAVSLKCRLGVVRRRNKGMVRAERLAPACERDLEGTHLNVYFSSAGEEEKTYMVCHWFSPLICVGGGEQDYFTFFLACGIFFSGWILFFFSPLTLWIFILSICHSYYWIKVDLGVPQSLTRFSSSHVGAVTLQGEALGCLLDSTRQFGVLMSAPPHAPSRKGVGWKDGKPGRITGRKSTLRRFEEQ